MAVETGNLLQVAFIPEVTFKTTPATPTGQILRFTSFTLAAEGAYLKNPELRTDRQEAPGRLGALVGKGELGGVLTYGTYDAFFEAALGGAWTANVLKIGSTRNSFTFERLHTVNTLSFAYGGVVVDSFELSGKADANVEVKFGLIAADCRDETSATIWTATTPVNTNAVLTSWEGSVKKGGVAIGDVASWVLKGANNYEEAKVVGSKTLFELRPKTMMISGTVEIFFDSNALYTDFRAENAITLEINLGSGSAKSYTLDLANAKITKFGSPSYADGLTRVSVDFSGFADATDTALKITRIP